MLTSTGDRKREPVAIQSGWLEREGIAHGFFTRHGGVSSGIYSGLNAGIGSRDDPENVRRNRSIVTGSLGVAPAMLACPYQVHSADALIVKDPFGPDRPKADAVVTATPGLAVGVLTADCGPVLFADIESGVVAAAHAGWKGALSGVLENTVAAMIEAGADRHNIRAVLGPTISQPNYEVGPEFIDRFLAADSRNSAHFRNSASPGHGLFDLAGYIVGRLRQAGVAARSIRACTYGDEARFYSYRRSIHRGEPDYGRQISAIVFKGD